eukprot:CAMPEP_0118934878 /NCGR_PEP_ID=MMETSP1169-20130426/14377_1 /TAXON_ID=36882 /ORGANISM="Pyramimonas obovata, Strain CCMP722" /LENGTH=160 /DNA_ID=CAMNT_0006877829 /DNA_START=123 /DNA_END=605 /DNA_ORIENTATION=+
MFFDILRKIGCFPDPPSDEPSRTGTAIVISRSGCVEANGTYLPCKDNAYQRYPTWKHTLNDFKIYREDAMVPTWLIHGTSRLTEHPKVKGLLKSGQPFVVYRFTNTAAQNLMDRGWTADLPDVPFPPLDTYQGNLGRWDTPNGIGEPLPKIRYTTLEEFK